jgi:phage terminase large subunit
MATYKPTTALRKIAAMESRLKIVQGGSSAGKTIAILLLLIDIAQTYKGKLISIVSESFPHLKKGSMRDFLNIMEGHKYYKEDNWNRTDCIYTFETGTKIEFFSADSSDKVRGPRRDILFLNEANNIGFETYTQLAIRTNESIYIDYNPVAEFWVQTELIPNNKNHDFLIITYKDNEGLPQAVVEELESRKNRPGWWRVYGEGLLGEVEGKIYKGWEIIDDIPFQARKERRGLDFGYSNDPTAIVDVYYYNGGYILDEICYRKELSNRQIADIIQGQEDRAITVADSAEPKSIDEIALYGVTIMPAQKGAGSIATGIQFVQDQKISVTKRSVNLIKEYRNYMWKTDKNGRILNVPEDGQADHCMDAARYALGSVLKPAEYMASATVTYHSY